MNPASHPTAREIARRVAWWKEPEETLAHEVEFLCRVMTWGAWEDVQTLLAACGKGPFRRAIMEAPPGILDPRSWAYWRVKLDLPPAPLPRRNIPA